MTSGIACSFGIGGHSTAYTEVTGGFCGIYLTGVFNRQYCVDRWLG